MHWTTNSVLDDFTEAAANAYANLGLGDDIMNHFAVNVRQTKITSRIAVGEASMVKP